MISINDTHAAPKAAPSYRVRTEAMAAAVAVLGPLAIHEFDFVTYQLDDGRWDWNVPAEPQPLSAAVVKANGGKKFLAARAKAAEAKVKGDKPSLVALATAITQQEATPMADPNRLPVPPRRTLGKAAGASEGEGATRQPPAPKTLPVPPLEAGGGIGPSFIVNAPADDLQTREAMLSDMAPACNGLDIKPMTSIESLTQTPAQNLAADLTIPAFLKREATPEAKEKAATAMKRIAKQVGPDRTIANPPDAKVAARRKAADEEAADAAKARRKAKGETSAAPVSDSPKAKKPASKAKTKTARHSSAKPASKGAGRPVRPDGLIEGSAMATLVDTVCRKEGATNEELCKAVGWSQCLPCLRKACDKAGVRLTTEKKNGELTRYFGKAGK